MSQNLSAFRKKKGKQNKQVIILEEEKLEDNGEDINAQEKDIIQNEDEDSDG